MTVKTRAFDPANYLHTPADIAEYLKAALEDGDAAAITSALGDVARAKGMTQIARDTGLSREALYRALSAEGRPEFATVLKVLRAFGIRLTAEAA